MSAGIRVPLGKFAELLWNSRGMAGLGGRGNQDFLVLLSLARRPLSNWGRKNGVAAKDMGVNMWVGRALIFQVARNLLKRLVAGEGFEPSTFGL